MDHSFEYLIKTQSGEAEDHIHLFNFTWGDGLLQIFPSICPHEGADLRNNFANCTGKKQSHCPWHGKKISSIATISLDSAKNTIIRVYNRSFTIQTRPNKNAGQKEVTLSICAKNP
jgi:nitrite reductase/ring-hydroxylating ferredoxin subunit